MQPDKPACLLMTLTPDRKVTHTCVTTMPEMWFPTFINNEIKELGHDPVNIPDNWIVRIDFQRRDRIPESEDPMLLSRIAEALENRVANVKKVLPLFDVYFCRQRGRNPLARENSHDIIAQDILYSTDRHHFGSHSDEYHRLLRGVRTDRGLHVFSNDETGDNAFSECLTYYSSYFFSRQRGTDRLDLVSLYPLFKGPVHISFQFVSFPDHEIPPLEMPDEMFIKDSFIELPMQRFDMLPTLDNHNILMAHNKVHMPLPKRIIDFRSLIDLHEGTCLDMEKFKERIGNKFSYDEHFRELFSALDAAKDETQYTEAKDRISKLAGDYLVKDFPDLRYCPAPQKVEAQLRQQEIPDGTTQTLSRGRKM